MSRQNTNEGLSQVEYIVTSQINVTIEILVPGNLNIKIKFVQYLLQSCKDDSTRNSTTQTVQHLRILSTKA